MSAQKLRDAARVLRELAEAVPESPWYAVHLNGKHLHMETEDHTWTVDSNPSFICDLNGDHAGRAEVATYIATMHPGVALVLARLLDNAAEDFEMQAPGGELRDHWDVRVHTSCDLALTIADLILGDAS